MPRCAAAETAEPARACAQATVQVLRANSAFVDAVETCSQALYALSIDSMGSQAVGAQYGAREAVVACLRAHPDQARLLLFCTDVFLFAPIEAVYFFVSLYSSH